jgi:hypothetical protein
MYRLYMPPQPPCNPRALHGNRSREDKGKPLRGETSGGVHCRLTPAPERGELGVLAVGPRPFQIQRALLVLELVNERFGFLESLELAVERSFLLAGFGDDLGRCVLYEARIFEALS